MIESASFSFIPIDVLIDPLMTEGLAVFMLQPAADLLGNLGLPRSPPAARLWRGNAEAVWGLSSLVQGMDVVRSMATEPHGSARVPD